MQRQVLKQNENKSKIKVRQKEDKNKTIINNHNINN